MYFTEPPLWLMVCKVILAGTVAWTVDLNAAPSEVEGLGDISSVCVCVFTCINVFTSACVCVCFIQTRIRLYHSACVIALPFQR